MQKLQLLDKIMSNTIVTRNDDFPNWIHGDCEIAILIISICSVLFWYTRSKQLDFDTNAVISLHEDDLEPMTPQADHEPIGFGLAFQLLLEQLRNEAFSKANDRKISFKDIEPCLHTFQCNSDSFTSSSCCTICLEPFKNGQTIAELKSCNHRFHEKPCIVPWLKMKPTCPICRTPLPIAS